MKAYITYLRNESGYHRYFHGSKSEAERFIRSQRENADDNNRADEGEPRDDIDCKQIPTDKKELLRWLNANCENASGF